VQEFWEELWKREEEFFQTGRGEFKHGTSFVAVSSIAEQYYCEYKIENEFALGEIPTEAKDTGTSLHDELLPSERISEKEFVKLVGGKEPSLAILSVWGSIGGLKVVGTPDHIIWTEGKPLWLVELKTTKGDPLPLWEDQENQARIYGLLLDLMGFDCSQMKLAVVRLKSGELDDEMKRQWILRISRALLDSKVDELESKHSGAMRVHVLNHDRAMAARAVVSKAGYWLGTREPSWSTSVGKCRACEFNSVCPKTLYSPASER
jgi:PD-(D/E)XK nuclease superfamily protein